jgi:hypothetical protein
MSLLHWQLINRFRTGAGISRGSIGCKASSKTGTVADAHPRVHGVSWKLMSGGRNMKGIVDSSLTTRFHKGYREHNLRRY